MSHAAPEPARGTRADVEDGRALLRGTCQVDFDPVTIVVLTGATRGIGRAAAVELARRGADVVLVGRDPERVESVAQKPRRRVAVGACTGTSQTWR